MIKAEPKTILSFIVTYFDLLRDLFDSQSKDNIIRQETLRSICAKHDASGNIESKLKDYKIIRFANDDFQLRDVYYKLFEFLLYEFKPILPEDIQKYNYSISEYFRLIVEGIDGDKLILLKRIESLSSQIQEFLELIEKNTIRLLSETRELKANIKKIEYHQKVQKAAFWIDYYILPLNRILDVNHSESISNKLLSISEYASKKRLANSDETVRVQFEKLYDQLLETNDKLLFESKILTSELLPLIERIKTESLILGGCILILNNPYNITKDRLIKISKLDDGSPFSKHIYLNTKEFFEQFEKAENVIIEEEQDEHQKWVFKKNYYKQKLKGSLPVNDYFQWCMDTIKNEDETVSNEKLFALCSLMFEEDLGVEFIQSKEKSMIKTLTSTFSVPKIKINENGI